MEKERELLACPFCGRLPILLKRELARKPELCWFECVGCNARTNEDAPTEKVAAQYWNTRANNRSGWVTVEERLPTVADFVPHNEEEIDGGNSGTEIPCLTSLEIMGVWMTAWSFYCTGKKQWLTYAGYPIGKGVKVIAWQPLPEPYIAQEDKQHD